MRKFTVKMMIMLIKLLLLCFVMTMDRHVIIQSLQSKLSRSYLYGSSKSTSSVKLKQSRLPLSSTTVDINLGQYFKIEEFLDLYKSCPISIRGVYAVEDSDGGVKVIESSQDIYNDLKELVSDVDATYNHRLHGVRVQTFKAAASMRTISSYRDELLRQIRVTSVVEAVNSSQRSYIHSNSSAGSSGANDRIDLKRNSDYYSSITPRDAMDNLRDSLKSILNANDDSGNHDATDIGDKGSRDASSTGIVSPFDKSHEVERLDSNTTESSSRVDIRSGMSSSTMELTVENVNKVLDQIRPMLISDGGNVTVHAVDVEERSIEVVLEGACGSCPSSTTTMKMGIEKILKGSFSNLSSITSVDAKAVLSPNLDFLRLITDTLQKIMPAITSLGGQVVVSDVDVDKGCVYITFSGPDRLRTGVERVLTSNKKIKSVVFIDSS